MGSEMCIRDSCIVADTGGHVGSIVCPKIMNYFDDEANWNGATEPGLLEFRAEAPPTQTKHGCGIAQPGYEPGSTHWT